MKIVLFRKKAVIAAALIIAVTIAAVVFSDALVKTAMSNTAASRQLPIYSVKRDDNRMSISFDAAWGNEDTAQIIDILARYDVRATFFVVGEWVDKYPESVRALYDAGHEIMNHSDTHPYMTSLTSEQIKAEADACADKIEGVTGVRPTLFRVPYGDYDDKVVTALREDGYYTIQWDIDSLDWQDLTAEQISKRVLDKAQPGSIVLFHNAALNTPSALPVILETLRSRGLEPVPVSELIYTDNYKIDHAGQQYSVSDAASSSSAQSAAPPDSASGGSAAGVTVEDRRVRFA